MPGAFAADTEATATTGDPHVHAVAEEPGRQLVNDDPASDEDGPYPITITRNTLASPAGYVINPPVSAGRLNVLPIPGDTPPIVGFALTGTPGDNDWHRSDVNVAWDVSDAQSAADDIDKQSCGPSDVTPPTATASATSGGVPYTAGATVPGDVQIRFTCTDATSGVTDPPATTITAEGETPLVPGVCTDTAGNTARTSFGPVRIARPPVGLAGATTPSPAPSGGGLPSATATRARLVTQVRSALTTLRTLGLARFAARGYTRQFTADQAGVAIEEILGASRGARQSAAKAVVLARGTSRFAAAGEKKIAVKLTKVGKRAMRHKRSMKVTARIAFRPASGKPVAVSKALTLKTKR